MIAMLEIDPAPRIPLPGEIVSARQRKYLVEGVISPPRPLDSTLVRLSCVDDDAQGQQLEVLWEKEIDAEVLEGEAWDAIAERGFDEQRLFAAYLHTLRWNCVTSTNPRLFQSPSVPASGLTLIDRRQAKREESAGP
jgi:hypothetical protein